MAKKKEIRIGKYLTYEDQQSLEATHDMLVKALPGQSYVKEPLNRVSTTQVTGDALMKVAVGGKGGFAAGTAGDVREKKKALTAELIRMEKKEVWKQRLEVMLTLGLERDYDDFTYQNELDASDHMRLSEFLLEGEGLDRIRKTYDEICGYRGAWKYVGLNGAEHRRYRIVVYNTLDFDTSKKSADLSHQLNAPSKWSDEGSRARHHVGLFPAMLKAYVENDESMIDDWMNSHNPDHAAYVMWRLEQNKPEFWSPVKYEWLNEKPIEPSEEYLRLKDESEALERKRALEARLKAPDLRDWRKVYNWELTKKGKTMFSNEKI